MEIRLEEHTVAEIFNGYEDNDESGVVGFGGKLNIRPAFQREFVYKERERNAVIDTVFKGFPLNVMYWVEDEQGGYELLDGQQRTISICQYCNGDFSMLIDGKPRTFGNLTPYEQQQFLSYKLMIYVCKCIYRSNCHSCTDILPTLAADCPAKYDILDMARQ